MEDCTEAACASRALQSKYIDLVKLVVQGTIPERLFAKAIITDDTLDALSSSSGLSTLDKGRTAMKEVRKAVSIDSDIFHQFCQVLSEEDLQVSQKLSEKLKRKSRC